MLQAHPPLFKIEFWGPISDLASLDNMSVLGWSLHISFIVAGIVWLLGTLNIR